MSGPDPQLRQAVEHLIAARWAQAKAILLPLAARRPQDFDLAGYLAECLAQLGEYAPAEFHARRATKLRPDDPGPWVLLAKLAIAKGEKAQVEPAARRAAELAPGDPEAQRMLAWILLETNQFAAARRVAGAARARFPADADFWLKEGSAIRGLGRAAEAYALLAEGLRQCPSDTTLAMAHAFITHYVPGLGAGAIRAAHEHAGRLISRDAGVESLVRKERTPPTTSVPRQPGRIRVGIVSPDIRTHSVAYFLWPIFEHHDRESIELFAYSTTIGPDAMTERLREFVHPACWRDVPGLSGRALADRIAADDLDLLIETAGYTKEHCLGALAHRPAPLQATHIGYPGTTGLPQIDVRIVDSITDPRGGGPVDAAAAACTELLMRLDPCFTCYAPPEHAPDVQARPSSSGAAADDGGRGVVFGCFNMLPKLNSELFAAWAKILARVPGSRLMLKCRGLEHDGVRADVISRLIDSGIGADRVEILGFIAEPGGHLAAYHRVDIALDTFPYCGTTTTCEALWMGVPVVTMAPAGALHAGRVGASLLWACGLSELVAPDEAGYVDLAVALAANAGKRREFRQELRERMRGSALCNGRGFGRRWSQLVRDLVSDNR